ncbi:MAG: AMP-binding protein [Burkholderiaceae bacterium]
MASQSPPGRLPVNQSPVNQGHLPTVWPTVVHMLADAVRRCPERVAVVCDADSLTYREYGACVAGFALELQAMGVGEGDRVALLMNNSVDIAIATFAVQAAGAQVVPLNPAYTASELGPILRDAACRAIVCDVDVEATLAVATATTKDTAGVNVIRVGAGARRLTEWRASAELVARLPLPSAGSLSTLQYTGGTTGRSKGVNLLHAAVAINVSQREALLPTLAEQEIVLTVTPLFHVYAVSMGLYLAAWSRNTLVILPRFRPDSLLEAIERYRVTLFCASPTILIGLMRHERFELTDFGTLRICFSGSAALAESTMREWESRTACPVCEGYGQTEAGPVLTYNPSNGLRKIASVGMAVPDTQVEIVDLETGANKLAPGEAGEIRAQGPQIMRDYRNLPKETAEALRDGWLYTGDIGELDADGYLFIRDRKKEMVIVSGYNVFPREVEEVLHAHPQVADAGVVGVPDDYRGERLVAWVVPAAEALKPDLLFEYLAQHLVGYKIPHEVHIVQELPRTPIGKLDRNGLRELAASR